MEYLWKQPVAEICWYISARVVTRSRYYYVLDFFILPLFFFSFFFCRIGTSEKGQVLLRLNVKGETGHSSMPVKETSISILVKAVHRYCTHSVYYSSHIAFLFTTVLSQWDFSHGKFGLPSLGKASCDRVALAHLGCLLGVLVFP